MPTTSAPVTPSPTRRSRRARPVVHGALAAAASLTLLLGCSKTNDVATNDSTTTAKPAASSDSAGTSTTKARGGDAGTSTTKKGSTTTTEEDGSTTTVTKKPSTTTTEGDTTTTADGPTTTGDVTPPVSAAEDDKPLCDKIAELDKTFNDLDPTKDPQAIDKIKAAFKELVAVAPDSIKSTLQEFSDAMQKVNTMEEFAKLDNDPAITANSSKMEAWDKAHCPARS